MSRLWACDRCGITAPHEGPHEVTLPGNWKRAMVRALPEVVYRDICPPCYADLDQVLQDWFREGGAPDPTAPSAIKYDTSYRREDSV